MLLMSGRLGPGILRKMRVGTTAPERHLDVREDELVRPLGRAGLARGRVGLLDLLARAGLPVPEGVVLTARAHREFLRTSGVLGEIIEGVRADVRLRATRIRLGNPSISLESELNREICEALIGLHARVVTVVSEDFERRGLESIPEVRDAIRQAWLSRRGLEGQLGAVARGEDLPTWPMLVQKGIHPQYTGWTSTGDAGGLGESLARLTLQAAAALGEPVDIRWGLEEGRWHVLSAIPSRGDGARSVS